MPNLNFPDPDTLNAHLREKSFILVAYHNCKDYEGMVLCIVIRFNSRQSKYQLALEWMSFGLDFFGDTLQESYVYEFESFEKLMDYLLSKYSIKVTDIPVKYQIDSSQYPHYLNDEAKRPQFETGWKKFREDFNSGVFLDTSLKLVYTSRG